MEKMDTDSTNFQLSNNSTIPFKKRWKTILLNIGRNTSPASHYLQCKLPDEIMLTIFRHLNEDDLCSTAQVCKRFQKIADDNNLWKKLYQIVFEYTLPLFRTERGRYDFISLEDCEHRNPWKESFRQLKRLCLHVRPNYNGTARDGRMPHFDTLRDAIEYCVDEYCSCDVTIFIHTGIYREEYLVIDSNLIILGAAPGNVAESVVLECENETIVKFVEGAVNAYLGYVSLKFSPNDTITYEHYNHYCLEVDYHCTPTIDHCIFRNSSFFGAAICVSGSGANPWIHHCDVSDCQNIGIYITNRATGAYEDNNICQNALSCVKVSNANPVMRRNNIHHGKSVGIYIKNCGMGIYEYNDIHNNCAAGFYVSDRSNPWISNCNIHHGLTYGISVHENGLGNFTDNRIHSNNLSGISINYNSNPTIQNNFIYDGEECGVYISNEGRGLIEYNDICGNKSEGIKIRTNSDPIVRNNKIHHGLNVGVFVLESSAGLLEDNEVFKNALQGIMIAGGSTPALRRNRIHKNKFGVYFLANGNGTLEDNKIYCNSISNVYICSGSNPIVEGNKIYGGIYGISVNNNGLGVLKRNTIYLNSVSDIQISSDSNPTLIQTDPVTRGEDSIRPWIIEDSD